ncbi:MAG: GAF domain-containing protein [Acidobacteria bacterium]|nr:GAF domain-containing protein [Acidobacteriota bacterium]
MSGSAQPEAPFAPRKEVTTPGELAASVDLPAGGNFDGQELDAALQLLVERAQYITGATGSALALTHGEEMVCRASAGSSAPGVGARLQVRSGLTGESISRKQLLRCDNAETDPRVNLETCRQLGIASIVVLPLLTRKGEVRGLFELFSDHAYAFEERDLIALERMADLTMTALDLAERKPRPAVAPVVIPEPVPAPPPTMTEAHEERASEVPVVAMASDLADTASHAAIVDQSVPVPPALDHPLGTAQVHSALFQETVPETPPAAVPEAMRRVQKCASCGFPVSEGRSLCVDCENKRHLHPEAGETVAPEFIPAFLNAPPPKESWVTNHVNVLAVLVLILSLVVLVVVFR